MKGICLAFLVLLCNQLEAAISIEWSSDLNAVNRQSDGVTAFDEQFEFLVGTFEGIKPSADNLEEWESAFRLFGTAVYSIENKRFSNAKTLTSNDPPFTTSVRAYIWGRNGTTTGSEWILIGKPSWTWPAANPGGPPPFPIRWLVANAEGDDVILGSVEEGGFHMQTASVELVLPYSEWVDLNFEGGEDSGVSEDFDSDGRTNFLEYALGSDPKVSDGPFVTPINADLEIEVARAPGREVEWVLQVSNDLTDFVDMADGFEVAVDEPERLVLKISPDATARRFFRMKAVPAG
jgi:hypothetical protein